MANVVGGNGVFSGPTQGEYTGQSIQQLGNSLGEAAGNFNQIAALREQQKQNVVNELWNYAQNWGNARGIPAIAVFRDPEFANFAKTKYGSVLGPIFGNGNAQAAAIVDPMGKVQSGQLASQLAQEDAIRRGELVMGQGTQQDSSAFDAFLANFMNPQGQTPAPAQGQAPQQAPAPTPAPGPAPSVDTGWVPTWDNTANGFVLKRAGAVMLDKATGRPRLFPTEDLARTGVSQFTPTFGQDSVAGDYQTVMKEYYGSKASPEPAGKVYAIPRGDGTYYAPNIGGSGPMLGPDGQPLVFKSPQEASAAATGKSSAPPKGTTPDTAGMRGAPAASPSTAGSSTDPEFSARLAWYKAHSKTGPNDPDFARVRSIADLESRFPNTTVEYKKSISGGSAASTQVPASYAQGATTPSSALDVSRKLGIPDETMSILQTYLKDPKSLDRRDAIQAERAYSRIKDSLTVAVRQEPKLQVAEAYKNDPRVQQLVYEAAVADPKGPWANDPRFAQMAVNLVGLQIEGKKAEVNKAIADANLSQAQADTMKENVLASSALAQAKIMEASNETMKLVAENAQAMLKPMYEEYAKRISAAKTDKERSDIQADFSLRLSKDPAISGYSGALNDIVAKWGNYTITGKDIIKKQFFLGFYTGDQRVGTVNTVETQGGQPMGNSEQDLSTAALEAKRRLEAKYLQK